MLRVNSMFLYLPRVYHFMPQKGSPLKITFITVVFNIFTPWYVANLFLQKVISYIYSYKLGTNMLCDEVPI